MKNVAAARAMRPVSPYAAILRMRTALKRDGFCCRRDGCLRRRYAEDRRRARPVSRHDRLHQLRLHARRRLRAPAARSAGTILNDVAHPFEPLARNARVLLEYQVDLIRANIEEQQVAYELIE